MYEIRLKIGGVEKTFAKDFINIADNMLAVEHQVRQTAIVNNEKSFHDPKKHHALNEEYLKMFVEMFGNQFTTDDLKQADIKLLEILNKLYIDALGGKSEEGDEKKEA